MRLFFSCCYEGNIIGKDDVVIRITCILFDFKNPVAAAFELPVERLSNQYTSSVSYRISLLLSTRLVFFSSCANRRDGNSETNLCLSLSSSSFLNEVR